MTSKRFLDVIPMCTITKSGTWATRWAFENGVAWYLGNPCGYATVLKFVTDYGTVNVATGQWTGASGN